MIERGRLVCDGCGEVHPVRDFWPGRRAVEVREYLEHGAESSGWLTRDGRHYCRTCRHAVERDALVVS